MARPKALTDEVVEAAQARLLRYWDPEKREPSMRDVQLAVHEVVKAKTGQNGPTGEALRKLAKMKTAGPTVVGALETFFGETRDQWVADARRATRTVEREERYPAIATAFTDARAVGVDEAVLGIVRDELGAHRGPGPTVEEVHAAIKAVLSRHQKLKAFYAEQDVSELHVAPKIRRKSPK